MWGCFLMSGVKILHFLKDWWKSIPNHQNYTMALTKLNGLLLPTEPKLLILVSFFSREVTSYNVVTSYCIHRLWEVCLSVFYGPPCITLYHEGYVLWRISCFNKNNRHTLLVLSSRHLFPCQTKFDESKHKKQKSLTADFDKNVDLRASKIERSAKICVTNVYKRFQGGSNYFAH